MTMELFELGAVLNISHTILYGKQYCRRHYKITKSQKIQTI